MRLRPSVDQLVVDSLVWSEQLRINAIAGCDDVMAFVVKLSNMPAFAASLKATVTQQLALCKKMGVKWRGEPIAKQTLQAIHHIIPFCQEAMVLTSLNQLKRYFPEVDKITTLSKMCKVVTSNIKGSFMTPVLQERRTNSTALEWALGWLQLGCMFGDINPKDASNDFLVGPRQSDVGSMQVFFLKLQTLDCCFSHYNKSKAFESAIGDKLWQAFSSPVAFGEKFAAPEFWKRAPEMVESGTFGAGQSGIGYWTEPASLSGRRPCPTRPP